MREIAGLSTRLSGWWEILTGIYDPPGQPSLSKILAPPNPNKPPNGQASLHVIDESPWEILRVNLICSLWCQKVEFDIRKGKFHISIALFRAWQATVQAGMGA